MKTQFSNLINYAQQNLLCNLEIDVTSNIDIHLLKVFLHPRFNIDFQAVIWLPCKHTHTHELRLMGIHITNTHPWTTSQKHRSHASESPLNKTAGPVKLTLRKDVWSIYSGDSMRTYTQCHH